MAVDPELLEILACPACKTPVTLVKNGTALKCAACHRVYPIKDDIPVMLMDEATVEHEDSPRPPA
jgi:LSD1 subclass zinc finger protein